MRDIAALASRLRAITRDEDQRDTLATSSLESIIKSHDLLNDASFAQNLVRSASAATTVAFSLISSAISCLDAFSTLSSEDQKLLASLTTDSVCALANYAAHDALKDYTHAPISTKFPNVHSSLTLLLRLAMSLERVLFSAPLLPSYFNADEQSESGETECPLLSQPDAHALLPCFGFIVVALSNLGAIEEEELTLTMATHVNKSTFALDLKKLPPVVTASHYASLITAVLLFHLTQAAPSILASADLVIEAEEDEEQSLLLTCRDTLAMCFSHLSLSLPEATVSDFPLPPFFLTSDLTKHVHKLVLARLSGNSPVSDSGVSNSGSIDLDSTFSTISTTTLPPVPANIATIFHEILSSTPTLFSPYSTFSFAPILPTLASLLSENSRFSLSTFPKSQENVKIPAFASILAGPMALAADISKILLVKEVFGSGNLSSGKVMDIIFRGEDSLQHCLQNPRALPLNSVMNASVDDDKEEHEDEDEDGNEDEDEDEEEECLEDVLVSPLSSITALGHCVQTCLHGVLLGQHAVPDSTPGNSRSIPNSGSSMMIDVLVSSLHQYILPTITLTTSMTAIFTNTLSSYVNTTSPATMRYALQVSLALAKVANDILSLLSPVTLSPALAVVFMKNHSTLHDSLFQSLLAQAHDNRLPSIIDTLSSRAAKLTEKDAVLKSITKPAWLPLLSSRALSILGFLLGHRSNFPNADSSNHLYWKISQLSHATACIPERISEDSTFPIYFFPHFATAVVNAMSNTMERIFPSGMDVNSQKISSNPKLAGADKLAALETVLTTAVNLAMATTTNISPSQSPSSPSESPKTTILPLMGSVLVWRTLLSCISTHIPQLLRLFTVAWDGENQRFLKLRQYIAEHGTDGPHEDVVVNVMGHAQTDAEKTVEVLTNTYIKLSVSLSHSTQSPIGLSDITPLCPFDDVPAYVLQHKLPMLQLLLLRLLRCFYSRGVDDLLKHQTTLASQIGGVSIEEIGDEPQNDVESAALEQDIFRYIHLIKSDILPDYLASLLSLTNYCNIAHLKYEAARLFGLICRYVALLPREKQVSEIPDSGISPISTSAVRSIFADLVRNSTSTISGNSLSHQLSLAQSVLQPLLSVDSQRQPSLAILAVEGRDAVNALRDLGVNTSTSR